MLSCFFAKVEMEEKKRMQIDAKGVSFFLLLALIKGASLLVYVVCWSAYVPL
jgi:hypothetical protein